VVFDREVKKHIIEMFQKTQSLPIKNAGFLHSPYLGEFSEV